MCQQLGIDPREMKNLYPYKNCICLFIAVLLLIAQSCKELKFPSVGE